MGKVPNLCEADEVLEFCTAKTADTSSVLPYGNPPSPRGKAYKKAKTSRRVGLFAPPIIVGVDVLGDPKKTNDYRNKNGGRTH